MNEIGLYIHIPFCAARCHYCDFFTFAGKEHLIDKYVFALCNELTLLSQEHDVSVKTIFFGGGTPGILQPAHFEKIFKALHNHFTISADAEITVECNPGTLTKEKAAALKSCGVNRLSLGVQSFNDNILKHLGRIHTSTEVLENFALLRDYGLNNINMDFIFSVPGTTLDDWKETLTQAVKLQPEHISAYNFILEEETKFYDLHLKGKLILMDEEDELRHYEFTIDTLTSHGYNHYEISNFAKPGSECKHNLIYWRNENYLGAGASACSHVNGVRWENIRDLKAYIEGSDPNERFPEKGSDPIRKGTKRETLNTPARGESAFGGKHEIADTLMMGLRLTGGISLQEFHDRFGISLESLCGKTINKF